MEEPICNYCHCTFDPGSDYVTCPNCQTYYHPACWQENSRRCSSLGCPGAGERPRLRFPDRTARRVRETGDLAETMLRVTVPVVDVPLSTRKTDELAETMLRVLRAAVPLEEKSDYELDSLADRLQELLRQYEYHHNDDPPAFLKTILIEEMRDAIERVRQYKDLNRARREVAAAHERYDQAVERNKKLRQKIRAFFG